MAIPARVYWLESVPTAFPIDCLVVDGEGVENVVTVFVEIGEGDVLTSFPYEGTVECLDMGYLPSGKQVFFIPESGVPIEECIGQVLVY